jgi:LmbE family N-acetylglucosaminyl deacetylase
LLACKADSVVAVMAHPDDAEILCYGTLVRLREEGAHVAVVLVTDGSEGVSVVDREGGKPAIPRNFRLEESRAAFRDTGIELLTLNLPDGALSYSRPVIAAVETQLRHLEAQVIFTHHVDVRGNDHQDHSVVGMAAANVVRRLRSARMLLHCQPIRPGSGFEPNTYVDITDFHHRKLNALSRHVSQAGRSYLGERFHHVRGAANAICASSIAFEQGRMVEAFHCSLSII